MAVSNYIQRRNAHSWTEDKNVSGSSAVHPFTIEFINSNKKVILVDNPGQNSLENVRTFVARSGQPYRGLMIFVDSLAWNLGFVSFQQALQLSTVIGNRSFPVLVVLTKKDLLLSLVKHEKIDGIATAMMDSLKHLSEQTRIPYFNQNKKSLEWLDYGISGDLAPFTRLEQIFTNAIEGHFRKNSLEGMSPGNIRVIVRSFLAASSEFIKSWLALKEYKTKYPNLTFPDDFQSDLCNYRGTSLEFETPWSKISPSNTEPTFPLSLLEYNRVLDTLKRACLAPTSVSERNKELIASLRNFLPNCQPLEPVAVDTQTNDGIMSLSAGIEGLYDLIARNEPNPASEKTPSFSVALPPKPKPRDLSESK
ncbi:MAG TPA: hypothetical protein VJ044_14210 [Candidatus Hodarchaeales archaeon]|nr:hypothetical protein [Candidatus Hodarchaeales archaeon]